MDYFYLLLHHLNANACDGHLLAAMTTHGKLRVVVSQWNLKLEIALSCAHVVCVDCLWGGSIYEQMRKQRNILVALWIKLKFLYKLLVSLSSSYLSTVRPRRSHADSWVEFSHTFQWQGGVWRGEECVKIHCLEPPSILQRKWTHQSPRPHTSKHTPLPFTPTHPLLRSLCSAHSARGRHRTDNPKGHLWPPSLATPLFHPLSFPLQREENEKGGRRQPEGISVLILSFLAIIK